MPPKRKPTTPAADDDDSDPPKKVKKSSVDSDKDGAAPSTTTTTATSDPKDKKPTKLPKNSSLVISSDDEELSSEDEGDKSKPWCNYGANCYRKNPEHLKGFRHPSKSKTQKDKKKDKDKGTSKNTSKSADKSKDDSGTVKSPPPDSPSADPADKMKDIKKNTSSADPEVENYKNVLRCALAKNKVSVDEKRMLRTFRRNNNVSDQDHFRLLLQFGWSVDEYEDGQKKDDDCDLDEERAVLEKNGFTIISIKKGKTMTKEQDNVFSRVCAKFFQTMSKAQANYRIVEVGVIVNAELRKQYNLQLAEFAQAGFTDVEWAFHGSTRDSIKIISETGFLHPDNLNKSKGKAPAKKGGKKAAASKVTVLDDGFFGKGIYFSFFSDYAMFYSEERSSDQVLLSQVATGKTFKCSGRMDGLDCQKGYNSHYSPKGNEIVVFAPAQVLPRYVITFATQDAEEREQEG